MMVMIIIRRAADFPLFTFHRECKIPCSSKGSTVVSYDEGGENKTWEFRNKAPKSRKKIYLYIRLEVEVPPPKEK